MKTHLKILIILITSLSTACNPLIEVGVRKRDLKKDVEMVTDHGVIVVRLSDETPRHRNNFIKLVNDRFYNDILFHRVINHFLIQAGDPKSKTAKSDELLGDSDLPYTLLPELSGSLYHKRGALNAARNGDNENPEQASSSTQFTFIQGKVYTDSMLNVAENRINLNLAYNKVLHKPENQQALASLQRLIKLNAENDSIKILEAQLKEQAKVEQTRMTPYRFPEAHRRMYKTRGGAAHLDRNYTVFGEVVKGMSVVDSIARTATNKQDRPQKDIRIISVKMIKRVNYPAEK